MVQHHHEIRSLTGLRGVAAFLVMLHHFLGYTLGDHRLAVFSVHLYLAVDLFFILSGFVMAYTYQSMFREHFTLESYKTFLGRRIARIYPLYLFATFLCLFLISVGIMENKGTGHFGYALFTNIFLVAGWGFGPYMMGGPTWSISTEWAAYLVFPVLALFTLFKSGWWAVATGLFALGTLWVLGTLPNEFYHQLNDGRGGPLAITNTTTIGPVIRCLCGFTLGLLAFRATQIEYIMRIAKTKFLPEILAVLLIVFLFGRTTDLKIIILCAFFIITLARENSPSSRILGSKIPYFLGVYSYSLYLMHVPVSHGIDALGLFPGGESAYEKIITIILKTGVSLFFSILTFKFIENPGRSFLKKRRADTVNPASPP